MAKRPTAPVPTSSESHDSAPPADFNPFFKKENVREGDMLALTGWSRRLRGQFGEQIVIEVTQLKTGRAFDFAVRVGSINHRKLFKEMGRDEKTWAGQIHVTIQRAPTVGTEFVAIDRIDSDHAPF
jgi:hypothetical protein